MWRRGTVSFYKLYTEAVGATRPSKRLAEVGSLSTLSRSGSAVTRGGVLRWLDWALPLGYNTEERTDAALSCKLYVEAAGSKGQ